MNQLKTILVGVDFSECSRRALEQAVRLARWNNAQLSIIHVQDNSELELAGVEFPPPLDELRRHHRERAIAQLAEWAEQAGAPGGDEPRSNQWHAVGCVDQGESESPGRPAGAGRHG
ncbi:MAG: universal stress protein [Verrucomicrobiota bacterium]